MIGAKAPFFLPNKAVILNVQKDDLMMITAPIAYEIDGAIHQYIACFEMFKISGRRAVKLISISEVGVGIELIEEMHEQYIQQIEVSYLAYLNVSFIWNMYLIYLN
jgi:hypothetical protein